MRIQYSQFHPDPSLRGTINDKLPRHRALAAIDSGLATEIPYKDYRERLATEGQGMQTPDPNFIIGSQWGVQSAIQGYAWSKVLVIKKVGSETFFYATPPPDAPLPIVQQYWDQVGHTEDPETIRVRECQLAAAQQAQDIADKQAERVVRFGRTATTKSA